MDLSIASRKLHKLELACGKPLVNRLSKPITATPEALKHLKQINILLNAHNYLIEDIQKSHSDLSEAMRLMMPATIGEIAPKFLHDYRKENPSLIFSLEIPINLEHFKSGKSDLLVLSGEPPKEQHTVNIPRGTMYFIPVASPKWIDRYGLIESPDDIPIHQALSMPWYPDGITKTVWKNNLFKNIPLNRISVSTNASNIKASVLQGYAMALDLPFFYCADEILSGQLVPVLNGWHRKSQKNYVVCTEQAWNNPSWRHFSQWLAGELENHFNQQARKLLNAGIFLS